MSKRTIIIGAVALTLFAGVFLFSRTTEPNGNEVAGGGQGSFSPFKLETIGSTSFVKFKNASTSADPWVLDIGQASVSGNFEISGTASGSTGFFTKFVIGLSKVASSSAYDLEVGPGTTATASLLFSGKGCIQMLNTAGAPVYLRVVGTTLTVNQLECR